MLVKTANNHRHLKGTAIGAGIGAVAGAGTVAGAAGYGVHKLHSAGTKMMQAFGASPEEISEVKKSFKGDFGKTLKELGKSKKMQLTLAAITALGAGTGLGIAHIANNVHKTQQLYNQRSKKIMLIKQAQFDRFEYDRFEPDRFEPDLIELEGPNGKFKPKITSISSKESLLDILKRNKKLSIGVGAAGAAALTAGLLAKHFNSKKRTSK